MEQIFSFGRTAKNSEHPCPACSGPTVEIVTLQYPAGPTGIYRCIEDGCDVCHDPTMPQVRP